MRLHLDGRMASTRAKPNGHHRGHHQSDHLAPPHRPVEQHQSRHPERRDHRQHAPDVGAQHGQALDHHDDGHERQGHPHTAGTGPVDDKCGQHDRGRAEQGEGQVAQPGEAAGDRHRVAEDRVELQRPRARCRDRSGRRGPHGDERTAPADRRSTLSAAQAIARPTAMTMASCAAGRPARHPPARRGSSPAPGRAPRRPPGRAAAGAGPQPVPEADRQREDGQRDRDACHGERTVASRKAAASAASPGGARSGPSLPSPTWNVLPSMPSGGCSPTRVSTVGATSASCT